MFLRSFTITLLFAILFWPTSLQAQVSQTVSFTLSVTIPETASNPGLTNPVNQLTDYIPASSPHLYTQLTTRDQQAVLLESYVVD